ncbi:MAG: hypothetical protein J2P37_23405, partial [Ktedonobacteraceae bacterium]|nr:hypothetical protein [Ktedonobacteraceae bacterium]
VLGNMIEQATADLLFPEALATYRQGTPLSFGPLTLDQSGLTYKSKSLPWYEVAKIQLTSRYLLVSKHNSFFAWASITYRDIPNLRVVQRLSDTILGQSTEAV